MNTSKICAYLYLEMLYKNHTSAYGSRIGKGISETVIFIVVHEEQAKMPTYKGTSMGKHKRRPKREKPSPKKTIQ